MKRSLRKLLPLWLLGISFSGSAQLIVQQDFEDPSTGGPVIGYSKSTSGSVAFFDGAVGTSATNALPASSPFADGGSRVSMMFRGPAGGGSQGYGYVTFNQINTGAYRNIELSLRLAAFSLIGTGAGPTDSDYVRISISTDGNNFVEKLRVKGNNKSVWSYTGGTGVATHSYDQPASVYAPGGGGVRSSDGYGTLKITDLPPMSAMWVRVEMSSGYEHTVWCIDNFQVTGTRTLSGSGNTFYGEESGSKITTGVGNTLIGYKSGENVTSGLRNTFIGIDAGKGVTTGGTNTMIGYNASAAGANAANLSNATAIGSETKVTASNALILGNNANVGIGTTAPANKLEITATVDNQSGLRFTKLKSNSSTSPANNVALSVDANGDVILVPSALAASAWKTASNVVSQTDTSQRIVIGAMPSSLPGNYKLYVSNGILAERVKVAVRTSDKWADYVFSPSYRVKPLEEVEAFVRLHKHLPGVPSAEQVVREGLDVAEMNATLLEKIEELTLHVIRQEKLLVRQARELQELKKRLKRRAH